MYNFRMRIAPKSRGHAARGGVLPIPLFQRQATEQQVLADCGQAIPCDKRQDPASRHAQVHLWSALRANAMNLRIVRWRLWIPDDFLGLIESLIATI